MGIADEIVAALKENRLQLAYQPIIGAKSRRISHYECLLRLVKPDGQVVTAGYFVPAAEQMGIVHLIDRFALETVIAQLQGPSRRDPGGQCLGHRRRRSRLAAGLYRTCARRITRWRRG